MLITLILHTSASRATFPSPRFTRAPALLPQVPRLQRGFLTGLFWEQVKSTLRRQATRKGQLRRPALQLPASPTGDSPAEDSENAAEGAVGRGEGMPTDFGACSLVGFHRVSYVTYQRGFPWLAGSSLCKITSPRFRILPDAEREWSLPSPGSSGVL